MLTIMSGIRPTPRLRSGFQIAASSVQPRAALNTSAMMIASQIGNCQVHPEGEHHQRSEGDHLRVREVRESGRSEDEREADRRESEEQSEVQSVDQPDEHLRADVGRGSCALAQEEVHRSCGW